MSREQQATLNTQLSILFFMLFCCSPSKHSLRRSFIVLSLGVLVAEPPIQLTEYSQAPIPSFLTDILFRIQALRVLKWIDGWMVGWLGAVG